MNITKKINMIHLFEVTLRLENNKLVIDYWKDVAPDRFYLKRDHFFMKRRKTSPAYKHWIESKRTAAVHIDAVDGICNLIFNCRYQDLEEKVINELMTMGRVVRSIHLDWLYLYSKDNVEHVDFDKMIKGESAPDLTTQEACFYDLIKTIEKYNGSTMTNRQYLLAGLMRKYHLTVIPEPEKPRNFFQRYG